MSGVAIAAEVAAGIAEAAASTGTGGPLVATLIRRARTGGPDHAPTYGVSRTEAPCILGTFTGRERDGTSIAATDLKVTLAAIPGLDITTADRLEVAGQVYDLVEAMPTKPGGVTLKWTLAARK